MQKGSLVAVGTWNIILITPPQFARNTNINERSAITFFYLATTNASVEDASLLRLPLPLLSHGASTKHSNRW